MPKLRNGHAPGHVRDTADNAFEAWLEWNGEPPEPTVEYEIGYVPRQIPIRRALGLVWNCADIVPGNLFDDMQCTLSRSSDDRPAIKRRTYAACARAVLTDMRMTS